MTDWTVFLPAAALMALIPGANQVLGLQNAALVGVRYAVAGVAGRFTAFSVLIGLVSVGLGALLARSAVAFELIRWAGVAYLIWLGVTTFRRAGKRTGPKVDDPARSSLEAARREFITALTNPKALLLFASFIPQFATPGAGVGTFVTLAIVYVGVEAVAAMLYVSAGRALRTPQGRLRIPHRRLDRVAGVSFLAFGGYLALARRP